MAFRDSSDYKFEDLATLVSGFYFYNNYPVHYMPCHLLLQRLAASCNPAATRRSSVPSVRRLIETTRGDRGPGVDALKRKSLLTEHPGDASGLEALFPEFEMIRAASSMIVNPGTAGQMLVYTLDRFADFKPLLDKYLGFDATEACRSVRLIQNRAYAIIDPVVSRKSPMEYKRAEYRLRLETPSNRFLDAWRKATTISSEDVEALTQVGGSPAFVRFLSAEQSNFGPAGPSFGRWAFLRTSDGSVVLLIPMLLADTATSALHLGLLETLPNQAKGEYGRKFGQSFEHLVSSLFKKKYTGARIERRKKFPGQKGDTDLVRLSLSSR